MAEKAASYDMPHTVVDGMDFLKMQEVTRRAIARARAGQGPSFIEARCYRYRGHSMSDPANYRTKEEVKLWQERDPLPRLKKMIRYDYEADDSEFDEVDARVEKAIEDAVAYAEAGREIPPDRLYEDNYATGEWGE